MNEPPYRTAATLADSARPSPEYVYVAHERDVNRAFHRVWIRTVLFGCLGGACVVSYGPPWSAWVVILGVLAWSIVSWRRTRRGEAIVFRVEHGELTVTARGAAQPMLVKLPLKSLRDVTLDTKSISPVMRDTSISAVAVTQSVRGEVDIARILLVPSAPREPIALTEEHLAHMDAVEGAGKVRTFLRAHGWVPEDEREAAATSSRAST